MTKGRTGRSFVYTWYRTRPRTEPCGTPDSTGRTVKQDPEGTVGEIRRKETYNERRNGRIGELEEETFVPKFYRRPRSVQQDSARRLFLAASV